MAVALVALTAGAAAVAGGGSPLNGGDPCKPHEDSYRTTSLKGDHENGCSDPCKTRADRADGPAAVHRTELYEWRRTEL